MPNFASQMRTAFSSMILNTGSNSPGDELMTFSTSERPSAAPAIGEIVGAPTQFIEQPRVLDGDDGLGGEVRDQRYLLFGEWARFLAIDRERPDQFVLL